MKIYIFNILNAVFHFIYFFQVLKTLIKILSNNIYVFLRAKLIFFIVSVIGET